MDPIAKWRLDPIVATILDARRGGRLGWVLLVVGSLSMGFGRQSAEWADWFVGLGAYLALVGTRRLARIEAYRDIEEPLGISHDEPRGQTPLGEKRSAA